jgi:hypothetical protein
MDIEINIGNLLKQYYNCNIVINNYEPYLLICIADIAKILNIKNIRVQMQKIFNNNKVKLPTKTPGGMQLKTYITYDGLLQILNNSRKCETIEFCNKIGINTIQYHFVCIEANISKIILDTFYNENIILQYKVNNYMIDIYFIEYKLAIECDELHHDVANNIIKDNERESNIITTLGCKFIRFKPFDKSFTIYKLLGDIHTHIKNYACSVSLTDTLSTI